MAASGEHNPWTDDDATAATTSGPARPPLASAFDDPWTSASSTASTATAAATDDLDPYSPSSSTPPTVTAAVANDTGLTKTSPTLLAPQPRPPAEEGGSAEGSRTPIFSSLASAFRRVPSSSSSPDGTPKQHRTGGVLTAIAGRGSTSATPVPSPAPRDSSLPSAEHKPTTEVAFDFNRFLEQMRDSRSDPIAKYLRSFLKEFGKRTWKVNDQITVINDFLDFISAKMRTCETWAHATDSEFDNAIEGMEKLVMNRVFEQTFTPALPESSRLNNPTDDLERDHVLQQRIRLFTWLREDHLDLPAPTNESKRYLAFAKSELLKVNQYKAPRDKLITILNCCKVIYGLMRHVSAGGEQGADLFVPYLILIVIGANPDHLVSNLQYIQRFRNPERLQGEAGYYLSSLNGAITFIEALDRNALSNITQDEFEHQMEQAVSDIEPDLRLGSTPAPAQVNATAEPDTMAQAVGGNLFDRPLEALRGAFSDLSMRRGIEPPQLITGVPATRPTETSSEPTQPSPRRRRGYTPSLYSRSTESLALAPSPSAQVSAEEDRARRQHQASLSTLAELFPNAEADVLAVVLLSQNGDMNRAIDSLLEMT